MSEHELSIAVGFGLLGLFTGIYILYKTIQRKYKGYQCGFCGDFFPNEIEREQHIQTHK